MSCSRQARRHIGALFVMAICSCSVLAQGILPSFMRRVDPEITDLTAALDSEKARSDELRRLAEQLKGEKEELRRIGEKQRQDRANKPALPRPPLKVAALVIGNSSYKGSPLPNPVKDAKAVADLLRKFGYDAHLLQNATRRQTIDALQRFEEGAAAADVSIFFFAGHGAQIDNVNYLVPIDMDLDKGSLQLDGVPITEVIDRYLPSKVKVVFLDACRNNPLAAKSLLASADGGTSRKLKGTRNLVVNVGLAPFKGGSGTLISYATKDGHVALDGDGDHSPYTEALLHHLKDDADIALVLRRVRQRVLDSTDGNQIPWEYGSLVGDELVLAR